VRAEQAVKKTGGGLGLFFSFMIAYKVKSYLLRNKVKHLRSRID